MSGKLRIDYSVLLSQMDWQQVVLNGGPPCFFIEGPQFCGRTERWQGHGNSDFHDYVSLEQMVSFHVQAALTMPTTVEDERVKPDIADWLKLQCQRLRYGRCTTLYCLRRGGYTGKGGPTDYSIATCEPYEVYNALISLLPVQPAARTPAKPRSNHFSDEIIDKGTFPSHISNKGDAYYEDGTVIPVAASTEAEDERKHDE